MKVIIAGSRDITTFYTVESAYLCAGLKATEIVSGGARGVDKLGEELAMKLGIPITKFPADWKRHKKAAGIIRNMEMGDYADALIAVWDGNSPGTKHMITYFQQFDKPIYVHRLGPLPFDEEDPGHDEDTEFPDGP